MESHGCPPPPLEGLVRAADQVWGQRCPLPQAVRVSTRSPNLGPLRGASPQRKGERRNYSLLLAALLAGTALVAATDAMAQSPDTSKRILILPPLQWNETASSWHYATQQSTADLGRIMGGLTFGLKPEEVSERLPKLGAELHWTDLPAAQEFSEDVRFLRMPMRTAAALLAPVTACFGEPSNVVLLFRNKALFRVSWRFLPDQSCPSPRAAAAELYAAYVPLAPTVALSVHYRTGPADVVDVTDPAAQALVAQRWQARSQ